MIDIGKMAADALKDERKVLYALKEALSAMLEATNGFISKPQIRKIIEARQKALKAIEMFEKQDF